MPVRFTSLFSVFLCTLVALGCAPRPDPENSAEMARVFGECSFKLNTNMLDLEPLPENDPRVEIIDSIVADLTASRYEQFPWQVKTTVFDHPVPNAFTTGGGYLAAFSGVYAMADNEAALAGVIAHELAHMDKLDPMEMANYLESMLASRFEESGLEDYEAGQALQTVVDFCLAIPGLVSWQWPKDLNDAINDQAHPTFNNQQTPFVPFTFSDDPSSNYSPEQRDPQGRSTQSVCNDKLRDHYDEFVIINPEYYLAQYPDRDSLPPIPDDLQSGVGGLPGAQALWGTDPWLAFQHTAFARYAECQSDESGMLNLFASNYNPLALNSAFSAILNLFGSDESGVDWRFQNHPSLAQRIEDNRNFIDSNPDHLPDTTSIEANPDSYLNYKIMADQVDAFNALRDTARNRLTISSTAAFHSKDNIDLDYAPITVVDLAVLLNRALREAQANTASQSQPTDKCTTFKNVYKQLTGQYPSYCIAPNYQHSTQ